MLGRTLELSLDKGFVPRELVPNEVAWFYDHLGIDDTYFTLESTEVIADHILALFGAKVLAFTRHDPDTLVIDLERIDDKGNGATFIHTSAPGMTALEGPGATCETRYVSQSLLQVHLHSYPQNRHPFLE